MKPVAEREFAAPNDVSLLVDFFKHERHPDNLLDFPSLADLQEMLGDPGIQANTHLWLNEAGTITAYAIIDPDSATLIFEARGGPGQAELEDTAIRWGCEQFKNLELPDALETGCVEDNHGRTARLEQAGFVRLAEMSLDYARPLDGSLPDVQLPPGYLIRPLRGEFELNDIVALHQAACGTQQMTLTYRRAMIAAPAYLPLGDLVAVDPHGQLAGYCTCWIDSGLNEQTGRCIGYTDPVGVRPDCRRIGLCRALLVSGFHFLKSHGITTAALGTSSENLAARAAFEAAGFRLISSKQRFRLYPK